MTAMGFISCTLNRHKGYKPPAIYIHLLSWDQSEFIWQQWPSNQLGEFIDWGWTVRGDENFPAGKGTFKFRLGIYSN